MNRTVTSNDCPRCGYCEASSRVEFDSADGRSFTWGLVAGFILSNIALVGARILGWL